jgi:hypothetical protein
MTKKHPEAARKNNTQRPPAEWSIQAWDSAIIYLLKERDKKFARFQL